MSAQPSEQPTGYPSKTLRAIRAAVPDDQRAAFEEGLSSLDLGDLGAVASFRDKWWGRAVAARDSELDSDSHAAMAGDLELGQPWALAGRR
ncbi:MULTISPECIES: hypothetical protein [unclassified Streptomyces]|uniref:hypothetical protein n=1 Tax=unclassified Streptomyces TaxID=2593676 RepID=UPI00225C19E2|nr:hypothetical protein [Streptomyces sp. NBC_01264]MCX4783944.1 hypothetical protein [Streptomyces sp. NBC_01264]